MTKKNKNSQEGKPEDNEPVTTNAGLNESASVGGEASESGSETQSAGDISVDDLLDDVRRSLIDDEQDGDKKKSGWLGRIKKGFQKDQPADVSRVDAPIEKTQAPPKDDEYLDQIDELIDMLDPNADSPEMKAIVETEPLHSMSAVVPIETMPEEPAESTAPVDLDELKKRVFHSGEGGVPEENYSEVRAVALEGGEEVFVEVEARKENAKYEREQAFENAIRPYRKYIYFLIAFLGVLLAVAAGSMIYIAYQRSLPPKPTPIQSNLPIPKTMILPGELSFALGNGAIVDGKWNPRGPEWLAGTEICRWVAIPWSRQLEAVVRTFTRQDTIELVMSNDDRLVYTVYSIQELTLAEMQDLDQNSPCLLLVLAKADAEKRWVVTAKP